MFNIVWQLLAPAGRVSCETAVIAALTVASVIATFAVKILSLVCLGR